MAARRAIWMSRRRGAALPMLPRLTVFVALIAVCLPGIPTSASNLVVPGQTLGPDPQPLTPDPQSPPQGRWTLINAPPALSQHTALWDAAGAQMLVFGGASGSRQADVWSYRPATDRWAQLATAAPARVGLAGQSAVWDPVRSQFLIYGGLGPAAGGDLWSYRPASGAWVDLAAPGTRPPARAFHSAVWDPGRDQMLVFAGLGSGFGLMNDLWAYRPATNTWVELQPPRPRPLPVFYHSAVWDPVGQQMLVFGGTDPFTGQLVDELWSFGIETGAWTEIHVAGAPPARLSHVAVWDGQRAEMLVFGGGCGPGCFRDDLWSFRPGTATWTELPAIGPFPAGRGGHTGVWDEAGGRMLVFGGSIQAGTLNDLWEYRPATYAWRRLALERPDFLASSAHRAAWDAAGGQMIVVDSTVNRVWSYRSADNTWTDTTPSGAAPSPRDDPSVVWDATENRLLLFGGLGAGGYLADLWSYRPGGGWSRLDPTGPGPPGRLRHTAVWDSWSNQMLVFGGYRDSPLDDLWAYRPATNSWLRLDQPGRRPMARQRHSAVWDDVAGRMLLFGGLGGDPLSDLWSYDSMSNAWTELARAGVRPPSHFEHGAVWDADGGQMLVYGGYGGRAVDDLWSYRPAADSWLKLRPWGSPPPARGAFSLAWDSNSRRMLAASAYLGGRTNSMWAYRPLANVWAQPEPARPAPSARHQHVAVWNDRDGTMLLFGGYRSGTEFLDDLWSYRPHTRSWVRLDPSGARPSPRSGSSAAWDSSSNRLLVFGGYGVNGYRADLWSYSPDANAWTEVGRNSERPAPREEAIAVWDTANAQLLVYGGDREGRSVDDLWAYRPVSDAWVELDPAAPWPAARFRHAAVWDPTGEQMLVFAGYGGGFPGGYLNDVWSYHPSTNAWTRVETIGPLPAPRARHVAVWDAAAQRLLVWGGFAGGVDYLADLWTFYPLGGQWQSVVPAVAPAARAAATGAWDPDRRQLLIHGGGGSALSDELWSYHEE